MTSRITCTAIYLLLACGTLTADVRLSRVIGHNAVLQRDMPVAIWGKADPGEAITVHKIAPFGGPIHVRVGGTDQALGRAVATHVVVETEKEQDLDKELYVR